MVKIRLERRGAKKRPHFRLVAIDVRRAPSAKPLERLGYYNPLDKVAPLRVYKSPALRWYFTGARATDTAYAVMKRAGVVSWINKVKTKQLTLEQALEQTAREDDDVRKSLLEQGTKRSVPEFTMPGAAAASTAPPEAPKKHDRTSPSGANTNADAASDQGHVAAESVASQGKGARDTTVGDDVSPGEKTTTENPTTENPKEEI